MSHTRPLVSTAISFPSFSFAQTSLKSCNQNIELTRTSWRRIDNRAVTDNWRACPRAIERLTHRATPVDGYYFGECGTHTSRAGVQAICGEEVGVRLARLEHSGSRSSESGDKREGGDSELKIHL
jgi:hypothetical protein